MSNFICSAASHAGNVRTHNIDNYFADAELGLWMVADGMRGDTDGEVASRIAVDVISESVRKGAELLRAIQYAHDNIIAKAANDSLKRHMTATVVAAQELEGELELAWVGNSRAYLYDMASPGALRQLSKDHSYMQLLVDTGTFTQEDLMSDKNQNVMTISLGDREIQNLNADHLQQSLSLTQKLILCSDGLTKEVSDKEIREIMSHSSNVKKNAQELVQAAVDNGGCDNVTVIVIGRD